MYSAHETRRSMEAVIFRMFDAQKAGNSLGKPSRQSTLTPPKTIMS